MNAPRRDFGSLLRAFRTHRGLSQQALAARARVSTRHLSFVETGRAEASRELVGRLARALDVPPRERGTLFEAAGYAAPVRRTSLDDASMRDVLAVVDRILGAHATCPAVAVDRRLDLVRANPAALAFVQFVTGAADPARASNLARFTFTELLPHAERRDELAGILLGRLRNELAGTAMPRCSTNSPRSRPRPASPPSCPRSPPSRCGCGCTASRSRSSPRSPRSARRSTSRCTSCASRR